MGLDTYYYIVKLIKVVVNKVLNLNNMAVFYPL